MGRRARNSARSADGGRKASDPGNAAAAPVAGELSAAGFLSELRSGAFAEPYGSELRGGRIARRERATGPRALALAALEGRLAAALRAAGREDAVAAELVSAPLLRIGPYDLLRPAFALVGGRGARALRDLGGVTLSVDPRLVLLLAEAPEQRGEFHARLEAYAHAAIREVWLLDVGAGWTEVYRSPWAGAYRSRTLWYPGEAVPVAGLPGRAVEALAPG